MQAYFFFRLFFSLFFAFFPLLFSRFLSLSFAFSSPSLLPFLFLYVCRIELESEGLGMLAPEPSCQSSTVIQPWAADRGFLRMDRIGWSGGDDAGEESE